MDDKEIKYKNFKEIIVISKNINLSDAINEMNDKNLKNQLHKIRHTRNKVNHLVYPILFDQLKTMIQDIKEIKKLNYIDDEAIDKLLKDINEDLKLSKLNITDIKI